MSSKILKNTVSLTALGLLAKGIAAIWTFYLARRLGVAQYGLWANIFSIIAIFGNFQGVGIASLIFKEVSQKRSDASKYLSVSLFVYVASSVLIFIAVHILAVSFGYRGIKLGLSSLAAFSFIAVAPGLAAQGVLYGLEEYVRCQSFFLGSSVLYYLLGFAFIEQGLNVLGAFLAFTIGYIAYSIALMAHSLRKYKPLLWEGTLSKSIPLLRLGFPLALSIFLTETTLRFDRVLIDFFLGESAVGLYHAAFNLLILSREVLLIPFFTAIAAKLYSSWVQDKEAFQKLFEQANVILLMAAFAVIGPAILFPEVLIEIFYGKKFSDSAALLPVIIFSLAPLFLFLLWQHLFILQGKTGKLFFINLFGAVFSITLNVICLPHFGLKGVAWVSILSTTSMAGLIFYCQKREGLFSFKKRLLRILLAFLGATLLTFALKGKQPSHFHAVLWMAFETILYFSFLGLLHAFTKEERNWLLDKLQFLNPFTQTMD